MDEAGVYRCQDNELINERADLYLTVMDDILWKNSSIDVKAGVGDDVTIFWEYSIIGIDKNIIVFRNKNETTPSPEIIVENEKLIDKDDARMKFNITESDGGSREVVMLTIHNTTIDDFNYIYNMEIQFNDSCVRYAENSSLIIAVPRVYSQIPEMIGRPTEDIKFVWHYHYSSPATNVIFNRHNTSTGQNERVGYWNGTGFYSYIGEDRLQFSNTSVSFGQEITVTLKNTTVDDFNTTYGCNITFSDGVIGYNGTKLLYNPGPRMEKVPTQGHGKLGDDISLYWIYTYLSKATDVRFFHINSSGQSFLTGHWIKNQGYQSIGNNSAVFYQSTVEGKEKITLVILNTDENDYNYIYTCEVIFDDISRNLTAIELILIPDTVIPGNNDNINTPLMVAVGIFFILTVLLSTVLGIVLRRKKKAEIPTSDSLSNENPRSPDTISHPVDENISFCTKLCWSGEYAISEYSEYSSDDISLTSQCDNLGTYV